jgi:hypothetical protein
VAGAEVGNGPACGYYSQRQKQPTRNGLGASAVHHYKEDADTESCACALSAFFFADVQLRFNFEGLISEIM